MSHSGSGKSSTRYASSLGLADVQFDCRENLRVLSGPPSAATLTTDRARAVTAIDPRPRYSPPLAFWVLLRCRRARCRPQPLETAHSEFRRREPRPCSRGRRRVEGKPANGSSTVNPNPYSFDHVGQLLGRAGQLEQAVGPLVDCSTMLRSAPAASRRGNRVVSASSPVVR